MRKLFKLSFILLLFVILLNISSYATLLDGLHSDSLSGWNLHGSPYPYYHMGTRSTTFHYPSSSVYNDIINTAIAMWNEEDFNYINMTESENPPGDPLNAFVIEPVGENNYVVGYCNESYTVNSTTKEVTHWCIELYTAGMNNCINDQMRANGVAHEIGHVYGLAHCATYSGGYYSIMKEGLTSSMAVLSTDKRGMLLVTHVHTHPNASWFTYSYNANNTHIKRCIQCQGYYIESCQYVVISYNPYIVKYTKCGHQSSQ